LAGQELTEEQLDKIISRKLYLDEFKKKTKDSQNIFSKCYNMGIYAIYMNNHLVYIGKTIRNTAERILEHYIRWADNNDDKLGVSLEKLRKTVQFWEVEILKLANTQEDLKQLENREIGYAKQEVKKGNPALFLDEDARQLPTKEIEENIRNILP